MEIQINVNNVLLLDAHAQGDSVSSMYDNGRCETNEYGMEDV